MQCQDCHEEMRWISNRNHHRCLSCDTYVFASELDDPAEPLERLGQAPGVACPKCHVPLEFANLHGKWRVCLCTRCRGYVIEKGCLATIIHEKRMAYQGEDAAPTPMDPRELDGQLDCPACLEAMETHPYYGPGTVVINSCNGCGVAWLDHWELAAIIRAPGKRPARGSSPIVPARPVSNFGHQEQDPLLRGGVSLLNLLLDL
ncbi:zf-TFIIB domain-containing protein [Rhodopirellula sp. MGV]|uniref:zf-TFIIB domain-containing protein n=1 Tax=Rhodopirellula sp. MGV TaxID=2023130 RepID=UPI000BCA8076|nr:hypothetical protein [Rhodopirellula sp. MGV]OYP29868.1 hypothetical protein CGZ80_24070 [Rhodopirellula sp. MGV]